MHADATAPTLTRRRPRCPIEVDDPVVPELRQALERLGPRELLRQVELLVPAPAAGDVPSLADWPVLVESFLTRYSAPKTVDAYRMDLEAFRRWCAARDANPFAAQRVDVELYARWMEKNGYAPSTRHRRIGAIHVLFKTLLLDELVAKDPTVHVKRPKIERESSTSGLTRTEFADLLKIAEESAPAHLALVCLLGLNGLRVSEACSLRIEEMDGHRGARTISFARKGHTRRATAPLAVITAWAVEQAVAGRADGPVLLNGYGNAMNPHNAWRTVKKLAAATGITKRISPHSLRHSFVTNLLDAGVSERDVMIGSGHRDVRMVAYYDRGRENLDRHPTHTLAAHIQRSG